MNNKPPRLNLIGRFFGESLLWRLLRESLPEHKGKYAAAIVAMVFVAATTALSAWVMGEIIDSMTDSQDRGRVYWVAGGVALIFFAKGIASFAQTVLMARAGNRMWRKSNRYFSIGFSGREFHFLTRRSRPTCFCG